MYFLNMYNRKPTSEFITNVETHDSEHCSAMIKNPSKGTQTDYRESETQTIPWEPPYRLLTSNDKPEVLSLKNLRWNDGLPLGMYEINVVKKMRMKKAWESVLPPLDCKVNVQTHNAIIAMIDRDEWVSRDKELQLAMDARMVWINKMIEQYNIEQENKTMLRLEKIEKHLNKIRNEKMTQIKHELSRKLRKLDLKYRSRNSKVVVNPIYSKKFTEKKCHTVKPKLATESLDSFRQFFDSVFRKKGIGDYKQTNIGNFHVPIINPMMTKRNKKHHDEICIRETRWTDEKLQNLHKDLKNIRLNVVV